MKITVINRTKYGFSSIAAFLFEQPVLWYRLNRPVNFMRRLREAIAPNKFDLIPILQKQIIARLYHFRKCASDQSTNKRLGFRLFTSPLPRIYPWRTNRPFCNHISACVHFYSHLRIAAQVWMPETPPYECLHFYFEKIFWSTAIESTGLSPWSH